MAEEELKGQMENANKKCYCERCKKMMSPINFYTYRDKSKTKLCKPCLTAHVDNFNPDTFEWILRDLDVPFVPTEWNSLRDKLFAKDPHGMTGATVLGRYLAKMKLKQWRDYHYGDSEAIQQDLRRERQEREKAAEQERAAFEATLKVRLSEGRISEAEYQTLVSTETQNRELLPRNGNVITGEYGYRKLTPYEEAVEQLKNPYQEQNFLSEGSLIDPGADLSDEDKMYLAIKWGRLYRPAQWVTLETLYNEFMKSFDIQGAARVDTLKMICKTSLKMNEAIDAGDIESYQKLSRVYDSMMKAARFTEAQNKDSEGAKIDSVSALVDFAETRLGAIPRYKCEESQDLVDEIILDLKKYTRSLVYEDKALAQEIEKYLQSKKIAEEIKRNKQENKGKKVEISDEDHLEFKKTLARMKEDDDNLTDESIEEEYQARRVQHT